MARLALWLLCAPWTAALHGQPPVPTIEIPYLETAPHLSDFSDRSSPVPRRMASVEGFIQRTPRDGQPASQQTTVYLGYDDENLYVVFDAFDSEPAKIRARLDRRENIDEDDFVEIMLDTFQDRRRAYTFRANPYGVQWDAIWTEGRGFDDSFDTLWHSRGTLWDSGYRVWMAIPFKSLRFDASEEETWGIILKREVPRGQAEEAFWPAVSSRVEGRLSQSAQMRGLRRLKPGRNLQFIPYAGYRAFEVLEEVPGEGPGVVSDSAQVEAGLDAKYVVKDRLVLDATVNPDFSQVESDQPQVTVNQRFELFFPERRPFFVENASFFQTPLSLVFTRRIADPRFGVRLTGKAGPYTIGAMWADDESPGKGLEPENSLLGSRAWFGIARINRDLADQSTLGFLFTQREHEGSFNRVAGVDGRFKLNDQWVTSFQAVGSATRRLDGSTTSGPAYTASVSRSGRQFSYFGNFTDIGAGFRTETGFINRTDIRRTTHFASYFFRPEGDFLVFWGPEFLISRSWDHNGVRLDEFAEASLEWHFPGQTAVELNYRNGRERLRPGDFSGLGEALDFSNRVWCLEYETSFSHLFSLEGTLGWGRMINFAPLAGQAPAPADWLQSQLELTFHPTTALRIDNDYLLTRLREAGGGRTIFNNHIFRSRWNFQFNREWSIRTIVQYETLLANAAATSLETSKNFNLDLLLTYRLNPWTALYAGYNSNLQNLDLVSSESGPDRLLRTRNDFLNDGRQFFIKLSYLLRF